MARSSVSNLAMLNDITQQFRKAYPTCTEFRIMMKHDESKNMMDADLLSVAFDSRQCVKRIQWQLREERPAPDHADADTVTALQSYIQKNTQHCDGAAVGKINKDLDCFLGIMRERVYAHVWIEIQQMDVDFSPMWVNVDVPLGKAMVQSNEKFNKHNRESTEYGLKNLPFISKCMQIKCVN